MTRARILLADDHKAMREKIVHLLEGDFDVLGAFEDGQAIVEAASRLEPDVCVLDISMPMVDGIEAANQLKHNGSASKIIFLTIHEDEDFVRAALNTGAAGYVVKRCLVPDLHTALREVLAGGTFVSSAVALSGD